MQSKSLSVCFLGPDGSGKSTIINNLKKSKLPFESIYYFHLKPIKNKNANHRVVDDPHKYPPYSRVKSYIKLFYFTWQYNWGWFKNIRPLKEKSSLIIFDRYFDDLLVDTKRYRYGAGLKAANRIRKLIPKPDLYFILYAPARVILKRKKEVGEKELLRQLEGYKTLADSEKYILIDVNRSPGEIGEEISRIIMNKVLQ